MKIYPQIEVYLIREKEAKGVSNSNPNSQTGTEPTAETVEVLVDRASYSVAVTEASTLADVKTALSSKALNEKKYVKVKDEVWTASDRENPTPDETKVSDCHNIWYTLYVTKK